MPSLPSSADSLLVRTYFGDEAAWLAASVAATAENEDGFRAYVRIVDDTAWEGASTDELRTAALAGDHAAVLFVADGVALTADFPIQVLDLLDDANPPFRCVASELWGVDNNLNLSNMDWDEFAQAVDGDGVHRGFI